MNHEILAAIFEQAGVGLCLVGPDHRIILANPNWLRATCLTAEVAIGADFFDLFPESEELAAPLASRLEAGETVDVPRYCLTLMGKESWWEGRISPLRTTVGVGYLVTMRDVTRDILWERERETMLEELKELNWQLVLSSSRQTTLSGQLGGANSYRVCPASAKAAAIQPAPLEAASPPLS